MDSVNNRFAGLFTVVKGILPLPQDPEGGFFPGQKLSARVLAKEGEQYLLQWGDKEFFGSSEIPLAVGQQLELLVEGQREGKTFLKMLSPIPADTAPLAGNETENAPADVRNLVQRYGKLSEKDLAEIGRIIRQIPADEGTAIRYLLDPHLLAAVIIPELFHSDNKGTIEIAGFKKQPGGKKVWEISLAMELANLGQIEIRLFLFNQDISAWIWAAEQETERIIRQSVGELENDRFRVEVVPCRQGPLIYKGKVSVDFRV